MTMSKTVPISQIASDWKTSIDKIVPFLDEKGIKPVTQFPFGKGVMRIYATAEVLTLENEFNRWRANGKKRKAPHTAFAPGASYLSVMAKKNEDAVAELAAKVDLLTLKVDRLLAIWSVEKKEADAPAF